jgi:outer membrane protein insertion porin family
MVEHVRTNGNRAAAAIFLVAMSVAAAAGAGTEDQARELRWIHLISDAPVDEQGLLNLFPFRIGSRVGQGDLAEATRLLDAKGIFRNVELACVPEGEGVGVEVRLQRKLLINAVRIHDAGRIGRREASRLVRLQMGAIYEPELVDAAAKRVESRYADLGFTEARVEVMRTLRVGEVDLDFRIDEGEPLLVGGIIIQGATGMPQARLEAELKSFEGARHASDQLREAERAVLGLLRRSGYYEASVSASWQPGSEHSGVLWVEVDGGPEYRIEVSGNKARSDAKLLKLIDLEKRLIITDGTWRELAKRMVRSYQEAGYSRAQVSVSIDEGAPRTVRFKVDEGKRYVIRRVLVQGNDLVSTRRLRKQVRTRTPHCFVWNWLPGLQTGVSLTDVLDDDVRRIELFYREQGFESVKVYDVVQWFDDEAGEISVVFFVDEAPQTIVAEVRREGMEALAGRVPAIEVSAGKPLDVEAVERERKSLVRAFQRLGYTSAVVETSIDREDVRGHIAARVAFVARAGLQRRVGAVIVQNNIDTRDRVVLRELPFRMGDPLNTDAMLEGQTNMLRLGLFRSVSVRALEPENATVRDVGVRVSERAPGRFGWGAGYNTRDGLEGFLETSYDNLAGLGRRVSLRGQVALEPSSFVADQYLGVLGFREPHLWDSVWLFRSHLAAERSTRNVDQFSIEHVGTVTALDRRVAPRLRGGFEFEVDQSRVFDVAPDAVLTRQDEGSTRTIAVSPLLIHDGRDDPFAPRSGVFESVRLRYALPEMSSVHFGKVTAEHSHHIPLHDDLILVYALRGGWAIPFDGSDTVPIRERFFLGGRSTVRGFAENDIGPRGDNGNPAGGDVLINSNVEFRFPLLYGFGGAVFLDGGGVYLQKHSVSIADFRRSAGVGLRYMTPVGPLSLDYGVKLDRREDESFGRVHFSIGTMF